MRGVAGAQKESGGGAARSGTRAVRLRGAQGPRHRGAAFYDGHHWETRTVIGR